MPNMDFSAALTCLKMGDRIARAGWNGKGMWLEMAKAGTYYDVDSLQQPLSLPFIVMFTASGETVPWLASQSDIIANDWETVNG